ECREDSPAPRAAGAEDPIGTAPSSRPLMSMTRMTCRDMVQFLMDYLSEELPDDTRAVFERHVSACPDCVTYLASYRETIVLCRESFKVREEDVPVEVPEDLVQAILAARKKISNQA